MVDEVRRRVQQDTPGQQDRKGDRLYGIRRSLQVGAEYLTDKQAVRLDAKLSAINDVIETTRPIARGFRNFTNFRLR